MQVNALQQTSKVFGALIIIIGCLSILAEAISFPINIYVHWPAIKVNSALMLIFGGIALWFYQRASLLWLTRLVSLAIVVIAGTTFAEYSLNINLGIDELIIKDSLLIQYPGRMSFISTIYFMMLGCALILHDFKIWRINVTAFLAAIVAILTLLALTQYLYSMIPISPYSRYTNIAFLTALGLFLFAMGILCASPNKNFFGILIDKNLNHLLVLNLMLACIIIPIFFGFLYLLGNHLNLYPPELGITFSTLSIVTLLLIFVLYIFTLLSQFNKKNKLTSEMLNESHARLGLALHSIGAGIWVWDIKKNVVTWDAWMYRLFDVTPNEFQGRYEDFLNLVHPDDRAYVSQHVKDSIEEGKEYKVEFRIVTLNQEVRYVDARGAVYSNKYTSNKQMMGLCFDITDKKKIELELNSAKINAEEMAEKAEKASLAKSEFLSTMSHELRTPLNGVIGIAGLLIETELTPAQQEYVNMIQLSGEALLSVINDILDFSKIEAGQMQSEMINFNLVELIAGAVNTFTPQSNQKNIGISLKIDPDIPTWVIGDPSHLRQILHNLLANAVKFTEEGEIKISTKLISGGNYPEIYFEIADTGIGIEEKIQKKLFKPFMQADRSVTRKFGGTGLGLAISKRLIEMMNGKINLISELGIGSRFYFQVKFKQGKDLQEMETNKKTFTPITHLIPDAQNISILLAEDDKMNQIVTKRMLEKLGLKVNIVTNGREAIQAYQDYPYDIILMDCQMPELDGYHATHEIHLLEKKSGKRPVIIAMTAYALQGDKEKCFAAGMDDYLSKPIQLKQLKAMLIRWIDQINKVKVH